MFLTHPMVQYSGLPGELIPMKYRSSLWGTCIQLKRIRIGTPRVGALIFVYAMTYPSC